MAFARVRRAAGAGAPPAAVARRPRPAPVRPLLARTSAAPAASEVAAGADAAGTDFQRFEQYVLGLQDRILAEAEELDGGGKRFVRDRWSRGSDSEGGRPVIRERGPPVGGGAGQARAARPPSCWESRWLSLGGGAGPSRVAPQPSGRRARAPPGLPRPQLNTHTHTRARAPLPGYGITCVLEGGGLLEKAAANISIIHGKLSPQRAQASAQPPRASARAVRARGRALCAREGARCARERARARAGGALRADAAEGGASQPRQAGPGAPPS
jgi:hypothetical protein